MNISVRKSKDIHIYHIFYDYGELATEVEVFMQNRGGGKFISIINTGFYSCDSLCGRDTK